MGGLVVTNVIILCNRNCVCLLVVCFVRVVRGLERER